MTSLYEITGNFKELENMDLDAETLADTIESLDGEFDAKADAICHVLANIEGDMVAICSEIDRLKDRVTKMGNRQLSLKD